MTHAKNATVGNCFELPRDRLIGVRSLLRMREPLIATHHENLTICISVLALALSFFSLGWNIYRDIILKPRLRVRFSVSQFLFPDRSVTPHFLKLSVVNLGPGHARVVAARARTRPFFLDWFNKELLSTAIHNYKDPFCAKLPAKIAVAETIDITFPIAENCLLDTPHLRRIGVEDSFGRVHWAPRKDLERSKREYSALQGLTPPN
jgi:hypothetical protein